MFSAEGGMYLVLCRGRDVPCSLPREGCTLFSADAVMPTITLASLLLQLANRTFRASVCKGLLGSCSIEVLFETPEPTVDIRDPQNVTRLQTAFREAVWVDVSQAGAQWPPNRVVYGSGSPDFCCTRNPSIGIPGTKGRQCNPDAGAPDSCDRLCCGRGHHVRTDHVEEEKCSLKTTNGVPKLECTTVTVVRTRHFCN